MSNFDRYKDQISSNELPPQKPVSSSVHASHPTEPPNDSGRAFPNLHDNPGNFLIALLRFTPFFSLFEYVGDRCSLGKNRVIRVSKFKAVHPVWFRICFAADFVLALAVTIILILAAAVVLYKDLIK
jgi:hypothetical protein